MADSAPTGAFVLVVKEIFGPYQRGDIISDPAEIEKILNSHQEHFVVKRAA